MEPLVLIHSLGADKHLWDGVLPALETRGRVITYDVRGHGSAPAGDGPATIDDFAGDLEALLARERVERVALLGLSMGGMIAQAFAAAHPDRVATLLLADTASEFDPAMRAAWRERIATARREGMGPLVEPTVARWFPAAFLATADPVLERIRATLAGQDPRGYAAAGEALANLDLSARLGAIRARTLVAVGAQDVAIPPHFSHLLHERIAGARLLTWPGVGHCPPAQIPAHFAADVLAFLA